MTPAVTAPSTSLRPLRVGMVGYGFMGAAHSHAWRTAHRFFDLPLTPVLRTLAGRTESALVAAAERYGFEQTTTRWQDLVEDPEIDVIDICTPGDTHFEIAMAALAAGKHVLCEKPLANSVEESAEMAAAASEASNRGDPQHLRLLLPPHPGAGVRAPARRRGRGGRDPPGPCPVPAGLALRRRRADDLAPGQGQGRLRRSRRYRCPHHRPRPVDLRAGHRRRSPASSRLSSPPVPRPGTCRASAARATSPASASR